MKIEGVIWLRDIVDKLAVKHQVEPYEVEAVFYNRPQIRFVEKGERKGEDMYTALGQTDGGRYLSVFFIYKLTQPEIWQGRKGDCMAESKTKHLPDFDSLDDMVEFFDTQDMGAYLDQMPEVEMEIDLKRRRYIITLEIELADKLTEIAESKQLSSEELVTLWVQEKLLDRAGVAGS